MSTLIKGKQVDVAPNGIATANINSGAVTDAKVDATVLVASGANPLTGNLPAGGFKITGLGTPTAPADSATKAYVDAFANGLTIKAPALVMSTANIAALTGEQTIDGVLTSASRVLLTGQTTGSQNGLWVTAAGAWSRPSDFAAGSSAEGAAVFIRQGTLNADSQWVCITNAPADIVDTNSLTFVQFAAPGLTTYTNGLVKTVNNVDVVVPAGSGALTASPGALSVNYALVGELAAVDAGAAAAGVGEKVTRQDHKHTITTGAPVNVGVANSAGSGVAVALANHVHAVPVNTTGNKNMVASVTVADNDAATATVVAKANALGGYIAVSVNGVGPYLVGDGTKVAVDCYFSGDGGVTARALSAVVIGDTLRWNGSVAGFQLAASDRISLMQDAF
jgi:hypothetical protein